MFSSFDAVMQTRAARDTSIVIGFIAPIVSVELRAILEVYPVFQEMGTHRALEASDGDSLAWAFHLQKKVRSQKGEQSC